MGPRRLGRGNANCAAVTTYFVGGFNGAASVRTRKLSVPRVHSDSYRASMGPRRLGRGNSEIVEPFVVADPLQWGRVG